VEEFTLDTRYAEVLMWMYTIFMFSPGLPGLYMIGFGYFLFSYWVSKFMCKILSQGNTNYIVLKVNTKPKRYTLHLATKTRRVMLFCLIPHFIVGLLMFTNSAIITETDLNLSIYSFMYGNNRYLNPQRFDNVHSAIFLTAFFLFLIVLLIRYTLWSFFNTIYQSCFKRFKAYLRPEKEFSENVYDEMSLKHLYLEHEKTQEEIEKLEELKSRTEPLSKLMTRLKRKLEMIE
jgi:hypothetical protein